MKGMNGIFTIFPVVGFIGDLYSLKVSFTVMVVLGSILALINTFI